MRSELPVKNASFILPYNRDISFKISALRMSLKNQKSRIDANVIFKFVSVTMVILIANAKWQLKLSRIILIQWFAIIGLLLHVDGIVE